MNDDPDMDMYFSELMVNDNDDSNDTCDDDINMHMHMRMCKSVSLDCAFLCRRTRPCDRQFFPHPLKY